jgi:hypothetical protein
MGEQQLIFFVFVLLIVSGVGIVLMGMRHRGKILEMEHRERMAMIEKGLMPPPERDPEQFHGGFRRRSPPPGSQRAMSVGVVVIALGLGLAFLIGFAGGSGDVAVGLGGAIAVLGAAFVVNALIKRGSGEPLAAARRPGLSAPPAAGQDEPQR